MNIIIVGAGKIGGKLAQLLSDEGEHNITVIDTRRAVLEDIVNSCDVMGVEGNGASLDTLTGANISETDILIAVTGSDEINLLTCLVARKLSKCSTIARVRNPQYSKELHLFKEDLGLSMIINPEQTAAAEIARSLRFPSAIQIDTFAKGKVEILKFKIPEHSPLCDTKIMDIPQKLGHNVLVCGVQRAGAVYIPDGNFCLHPGDLISIVATNEDAALFIKKAGIKTNKVKDTTIVGGGTTAIYLANRLIKSGIDVKIIEQDQQRCEYLCSVIPKATIINGDGTDNRLLLEEGIETCESFVSLTGIDEENILLSLFAKTKTRGKVITKINRITYDDVISHLGLDTIIYPKDITAEYILKFVRAKNNTVGNNIETLHYILDDKAEALEFRIKDGSPVADKAIENLKVKNGSLIACITRNGNVITPGGKDVIMAGDTVIIVTTNKGISDISDIIK